MASNLTFRGIRYIVPVIVASSALDSLLKEQPWVPNQTRQFAFYLLGPIAALGMVLVILYIRARLEIVAPRRVSNFVLGVVIGISVIAVLTWAVMYYQVTWIGSQSINSTALFLKYMILASGAVVFAYSNFGLLLEAHLGGGGFERDQLFLRNSTGNRRRKFEPFEFFLAVTRDSVKSSDTLQPPIRRYETLSNHVFERTT